MGFFTKNLLVNVLDKVMGFRSKFPAHQIGGQKNLWDMGGYGFIRLSDKAGSTVVRITNFGPFRRGTRKVTLVQELQHIYIRDWVDSCANP